MMHFHVWSRTRSHSVAMSERERLRQENPDLNFTITDPADPHLRMREKIAAEIVGARFLVGVRSADEVGAKP